MKRLQKHSHLGPIALRYGLAITLLWSVFTKFTKTEMVFGLFNNLGFTFVNEAMIIILGIVLAILAILLIVGKKLQTVGILLTIFFLVSLISSIFAGEAPFSVGPGVWKDFALLGLAVYFAVGASGGSANNK